MDFPQAEQSSRMLFKLIPSLKGFYEISENGKFLRLVRTKECRSFYKNDSGYLCVNVGCKSLKQQTRYVADLVAEAFLGKKPEGYQIDHIDRDRENNHYKNLRYVTAKTNCRNSKHRGQIAVSLTKGSDSYDFPNMARAARFIASKAGKSLHRCNINLAGRQQVIYGYTVLYADKPKTISEKRVVQISLFPELEAIDYGGYRSSGG